MIQLNCYDFKNDYILLTNFYYKQDVLLNIRLLKYINMEIMTFYFLLIILIMMIYKECVRMHILKGVW